jgi:hypothetical protein
VVLMCTLFGMALGGWMSGKVFDLTGSYQAAFVNGIAWNLLHLVVVGLLWPVLAFAALLLVWTSSCRPWHCPGRVESKRWEALD